ncbi:MAG TPA: 3'-5' exonuclease [Bacteroidales bacterium]|nr:3'-5' exonuclease [Bacteroidales bacterium]
MSIKITKPLAIFDLETTGVNVGTDRIVEICILKVMPDGKQYTRTQRINPTIPIPPNVTAIHGITDNDVKDKPTFNKVAGELLKFIENCDLCGFNALKFDLPLLAEEFLRAGADFDLKGRRIVDVQNIFHKMEPRNLSAAYRFYCNKELINAHGAEADTMATYEVLKAQLQRYEHSDYHAKDGSISTFPKNMDALHEFSTMHRFCDLAGYLIFDDKNLETFNFGKHKGIPVEEVFKIEPSYYDWMMKSEFPLYTKKIITAIKLRDFNKGMNNLGG